MSGYVGAAVVFLDTETTGLDPDRHEIWEIGLIKGDREYGWQLPADLTRADPMGLRIGRFHERRRSIDSIANRAGMHRVLWPGSHNWEAVGLPLRDTAETVAGLLDGAHIVGAVPSFDAAFLTLWLRAHGQAPTWHYHLVDVEALAAGRIGAEPPWDSEALSRAVGVEPTEFERHTALGDARWAKAIYEAVLRPALVPA